MKEKNKIGKYKKKDKNNNKENTLILLVFENRIRH